MADSCASVVTVCLAILNFIYIGLGQIQSLPHVNISILKFTPIQQFLILQVNKDTSMTLKDTAKIYAVLLPH